MAEFGIRSIRGRAPGDRYSDEIDQALAKLTPDTPPAHRMDSEEMREEHRRMLEWYYYERSKQAENRLEMAMDADFYDGIQWDPNDSQVLKDRGQMPLVYNEVAPMVDWLIGTERRTRVDWRVLPRTEDDVQLADVKTKVLKYVSDINRVPFVRSQAFADAVKAGIGWIDDGVRDDPTQDVLYSKYEDWRNVLWDSASYELDLSDARYIFRWRWVDEDVALMMFPDRADAIRSACEDAAQYHDSAEDDTWYAGAKLERDSGIIYASGTGVMVDAKRRRIKLIECQYRKPMQCCIVEDGPMRGAFVAPTDHVMQEHLASTGAPVIERMAMRVHVSVFTEAAMLSWNPTNTRHNRFSLTPIWCYRRSRDRLPYGAVRRVRDIQQDLNKRASKALFLLNTNQILADEGAVDDWNMLRDEADRPDGMLIKKAGKDLEIRRDTDAATGQIQMMTLAAQSIQKTAGINNENLGRQTNAVSGAAIEARQQQGSVGTTEPFDNLRLAVQVQGEKQLSLSEQFYTEAKVIRLSGAKGALEWVKINQPEQQPDGSVRYLNDITASQADFVVSEADYAGTMRQVMFESLNQMAMRLPPEVSLRLLTIAMEFSDLPNKDEVAKALRAMTGERDPSKEMTPEEAQQAEQQMAAQAEALQMQRESAMLALEEQRAKVAKLNAEAQAVLSGASAGGIPPEVEQAIRHVQSQAADQIDRLSEQLRKAQSDLANRTLQIGRDADVKLETARIDADSRVRVAEIQKASDERIAQLEERMAKLVEGVAKRVEDVKAEGEKKESERKAAEAAAAPAEPREPPAPAPAPAAPTTINLQIDARAGTVKKTIELKTDDQGNPTGAEITEEPDQ